VPQGGSVRGRVVSGGDVGVHEHSEARVRKRTVIAERMRLWGHSPHRSTEHFWAPAHGSRRSEAIPPRTSGSHAYCTVGRTLGLVRAQVLVHYAHHRRAFAHCRGDALDRVLPHVARGEYAAHALTTRLRRHPAEHLR